jgi:hypothetical protein
MGNFFTKKERSIDSVVLDELNRPLIPDVQHNIFNRLNILEKAQDDLVTKVSNIEDTLKMLNENIAHRNVTTNTDIYKANESIHNICTDMGKLVKNDQILKKQLDDLKDKMFDIEKKSTIQGLYTSESNM